MLVYLMSGSACCNGVMSTQQLERSAEPLATLHRYRGGVEHVPGGFEAFAVEDDKLFTLGVFPALGAAADAYAGWSATHPRKPGLQLMAEVQRVRRYLDAQRDANSAAYEFGGGA
jgi:hypothetical protein